MIKNCPVAETMGQVFHVQYAHEVLRFRKQDDRNAPRRCVCGSPEIRTVTSISGNLRFGKGRLRISVFV